MNVVFFGVGLYLVGLGVHLALSGITDAQVLAGGAMSLLTTVSGMLTRVWRLPTADIGNTSRETARVEASFISFMTQIGQIRLAFEKSYLNDEEMPIDMLMAYQTMGAQAQERVHHELGKEDGC